MIFTLVETLSIISVTVWQIWYIKNLFRSPKLIWFNIFIYLWLPKITPSGITPSGITPPASYGHSSIPRSLFRLESSRSYCGRSTTTVCSCSCRTSSRGIRRSRVSYPWSSRLRTRWGTLILRRCCHSCLDKTANKKNQITPLSFPVSLRSRKRTYWFSHR